MKAQIYFSRLRSDACLPTKRNEDAGYDIYACFFPKIDHIIIQPLHTELIPTGIASAFPSEYYFQIQERGSTGIKGMSQRAGVIDSGYRGEWFLPITNVNDRPLYIAKPQHKGELAMREQAGEIIVYYTDKAIGQALFLPIPQTVIEEISYDALCSITSKRGLGSLGSSEK